MCIIQYPSGFCSITKSIYSIKKSFLFFGEKDEKKETKHKTLMNNQSIKNNFDPDNHNSQRRFDFDLYVSDYCRVNRFYVCFYEYCRIPKKNTLT